MGKPILLLRLEGPLQSWGTRSRWDVRDTAAEPTKSGIVGLLGCALGYLMGDARLEELDGALRFGVRIEHPGSLITDYQTITDFLPTADGRFRVSGGTLNGPSAKLTEEGFRPATVLSPRTYLEDAAFLVALEAKSDDKVLSSCAQALQRPQWPLFLGRKACVPTRPIFEYYGDQYSTIEEAFGHHPWSWLSACREPRTKLPETNLVAFIEEASGDLVRQDAIRLNASRNYAFRNVKRCTYMPVAASRAAEVSS
ncbi:MAG TPA: type I-E CRISPR-associated protein Cas5/CasD [Abditibacteriaceae bacterium]